MPKYNDVQIPKAKLKWINPVTNAPVKIGKQIQILKAGFRKYNSVYVFSYKDVRQHVLTHVANLVEWKDSMLFFGSNKVIQGTLRDLISSDTQWPDLTMLSTAVRGPSGILLTNRPPWQVKHWFKEFSVWDYPHCGYVADVTVKLDRGPLTLFQPEIEPYLKKLGMPTTIVKGVVMLQAPFIICKPGDLLTFRQIYFLELLGEKLTVYQLRLKAAWTKTDGLEVVSRLDESDGEEEANAGYE